MRYVIEIETGNAAFEPEPGPETARIIQALAESLKAGGRLLDRSLQDANGNTVGEAYRVCPICTHRVEEHYPEEAEACSDALHERLG